MPEPRGKKEESEVQIVREYKPKYPLEALDSFLFPNLLRDSNEVVISENITWLPLAEREVTRKMIEDIESKVQKSCKSVELVYQTASGNRWIFLKLNDDRRKNALRCMQSIYKRLYRKVGVQVERE